MRNLLLSSVLLSFFGFNLNAQITPNGNSGATTTVYTNGAPNDPIYIWCAEGLANNTASLTAIAPSGVGPYTYTWFYHNQTTFSWEPYSNFVGATSTISNLASDGYRVQIYDNGGALVGCYIAWVWNMNGDVTASNAPTACNASNLSGTVSSNGVFSYYNPPPAESLITASTQFNVCFTATHTFVSDVGFYLVGPAACGSPMIPLSPNPGSIGQGSVCNSGDNISNLCFSNTVGSILDICSASVPLTGTYGGYGSPGTMINWAPLIGCNAAEGGWKVQIYDCIGADVGVLTNANISFSNLTSVCGSPTSINYTSGAIASAINDNSCSAATASIFQVPVTNNLTIPITLNATTTYLWTSSPVVAIPSASSSLTPAVSSLPNGNTMFYLTETVSYGGSSCTYVDSTSFTNICCTAVADAGIDASFCGSGSAQLGTPSVPGMTYSWSPATGLDDATLAQPTATITNLGGSTITSTYTLTVTNVLGGGCTATDNVSVTVAPSPVLVISNNTSICSGACTALSVSGADIYSWAPSPDITDVTLANQNVCPSATTTYNVTGYVIGGSVMSNGNFSGGAVNFTSDYTLNPNTQTEGTYFVTTNAVLTHPGFTGVDHTTGSGNFMVVNGSSTPNGSVWCQTVQIEPNTDYIFSTWVSTLAVGSPALLQFSINGTNLSTPFTAPAATGVWDEFYTTWNSGAATSATICIVNQNVSLGGNDFGIDDISFSPLCSATASVTVTVNPNPVVSAGVYPGVCTGSGNVALLGSPVGGTFTGTGVTGNSFNPASGTQLITYNYSDAFGCSGSSTATITVNPLPVVTAGVYSPVCVDAANVPLVGTPAGGTFTGTGVTANTFDPSVNTQTVTYSYTDGNSCTNTATASITVNPLPVVTAGVYSAVCVDAANVALVGTPAGGTFSGTGVTANSFDPSVGTQTVTYSYTNGNGCTNTATASITVNPLPTIGAGVDQTICLGTSIVLSGTGGTTYSWTGGATNGTSFVPGLGATTYTVTGTNANGCVNTDVVTITVLPLPIAVINANNTPGYPTLTVSFTNTSLNATSYLWSFGNGNIANESTTVGQTSSYSTPGTYQVILSASNGVCTDVDTLPIIVIPFPPPTVHVPNVFTPNGDGINDLFLIETTFATSINVIILNRWGDVIQEQTDFTMKWDGQVKGKDASEGVYFFKYEVTGLNGDVLTGHGDITLIR